MNDLIGNAVREGKSEKGFNVFETFPYKFLAIMNTLYPRSYNLLDFPVKTASKKKDRAMERHLRKTLEQISKKLKLNAFTKGKKSFLFDGASFFDHSCTPNSYYDFSSDKDDSGYIVIRNMIPVKKGTKLTISYVSSFDDKQLRMALIKRLYYFTCKCEACTGDKYPSCVAFDYTGSDICIMCGTKNSKQRCPMCKLPYCSRECFFQNFNLIHHKLCRKKIDPEKYDAHGNPL